MSAVADSMRVLTPACLAMECSGGEWAFPPHLQLFDREFMNLVLRRIPERILCIEAPPRHGKSWYFASWAPKWYLGRNPTHQVMLASYSADFAKDWGGQVRDFLEQDGPRVFNVGINPERRAASNFQVQEHGGTMISGGVGGPFTGRGANLFIVDDCLKNAEEAISDTVREAQWEWFQSTAWTRLEPDGVFVVIMTRWHQDDLIGRLLKWQETDEGSPVRYVKLRAFSEGDDPLGRPEGEPLWPDRWPTDALLSKKQGMDDYWWNALFQQRPGQYGSAKWPNEYFTDDIWCETWPDTFEEQVLCLDPSIGRNTKSDYAAWVFLGATGGILYVDARIARWGVTKMVMAGIEMAQKYRPNYVGVEGNAWQDLLAPEFDRMTTEMGVAPMPIHMISNQKQKSLRIERLGPHLARKHFRFKRGSQGVRELVSQLKGFPHADHDDGPDAMEMALRLIKWALNPQE